MSHGLVFLVTPGLFFSPLGVGKQGVGMDHPVPLQEAGAAAGSIPEGLLAVTPPLPHMFPPQLFMSWDSKGG